MPRTKQRKIKQANDTGYEPFLRDFNRLVELRIQKMEADFKAEMERYDMSFKLALNRYPPEIQNMTLKELLSLNLSPKKENLPPKTPKTIKSSKNSQTTNLKRATAASDDGYQSESGLSQASKLTSKRRSRSCSKGRTEKKIMSISQNRKSKLNVPNVPKTIKKDLLKTPDNRTSNTFVITPKIKLNSVVNVLRKPKNGEMVFSAQGSPLLVSTTLNQRTARVEIPLIDDKVVSLLPFHDTSLSENVFVDEETRDQLKVIHGHLSKILK